ncbi:MAG TPA: RcpC/CpaB family pilus assembly protein [Bellilinea sp.]|jgi:Flp pilus assembly protein CpaB|nr:RcpC/CpaB family pilus assembly protein [Bellilinea sp.]
MNRPIQFTIGLIALVLALGAGFYGRNAYLKEVSTVQIAVPVLPIVPYTLLSPDLFSLREVPRAMQTLPYFQNPEEMSGLISTVQLPAGLPVAKSLAVMPESFRLADNDFEVVSIPVEPVSAVGGQIHIGQRVNLYQMIDQDESETAATDKSKIEQRLQVKQIAAGILVVDVRSSQGLAADSLQDQEQESASLSGSQQVEQTQILTLALPPNQVQEVLRAVATAKKQGGLLWTTLARP